MYNECDHEIPLDFSKKEIEKIVELNTTMKYIREDVGEIKESLSVVCKRQNNYEENLWKFGYEMQEIKNSLQAITNKQFKSGMGYFFKDNWGKIVTFIASMTGIFGVIGDFLYHLPPPK